MPIFDIFSKREKKLRGEVPDVYQHEDIPEKLRVQIIRIWNYIFHKPRHDLMGEYYPDVTANAYKQIHDILCHEYGEFYLTEHDDSHIESVHKFFLGTKDTEKAVDVIELSFVFIDKYIRSHLHQFNDREISPDDAIAELNHRLQEHGVGYQYESGKIIRVDSEFIHSEAMKPALKMLSDPMYEGANDEFLKAHKHYRAKSYEACMNECLKAFESCMKAICATRRWKYKETDTASRLIGVIFDRKLIPDYMQSHFTSLRSTLESGLPTARNRQSGHGQGSKVIPVPEYMAAYALHLTASNILFLAKADEEMK